MWLSMRTLTNRARLLYFGNGKCASRYVSEEVCPRAAPYDLPLILLARLAVDRRFAGRGLGHALISEALRISLRVADEVGCRCDHHRRLSGSGQLVRTIRVCAHRGCCGHGTTKDVSGPADGPRSAPALKVSKRPSPRAVLTLQKPSISTPAETGPCFVGVFHTLNQRRAHLYH